MTQYFGLFAFSGKVTAFLAPLSIAAMTDGHRQPESRDGNDPVILLTGLVLLLPVNERRIA